jgi:hypothetical protein
VDAMGCHGCIAAPVEHVVHLLLKVAAHAAAILQAAAATVLLSEAQVRQGREMCEALDHAV